MYLSAGKTLEVLPGVRDWADYTRAFQRYLGAPQQEPAHENDDLIPPSTRQHLQPLVWEGEEAAEGVFVGAAPDDALALLGVPAWSLRQRRDCPTISNPRRTAHWLDRLGRTEACGKRPDSQCRLP